METDADGFHREEFTAVFTGWLKTYKEWNFSPPLRIEKGVRYELEYNPLTRQSRLMVVEA